MLGVSKSFMIGMIIIGIIAMGFKSWETFFAMMGWWIIIRIVWRIFVR